MRKVNLWVLGFLIFIAGIAYSETGIIQLNNPDSYLNIRSAPTTNSNIIGKLHHGNIVDIMGRNNGFCKINCGNSAGYVSSDYVKSSDNISGKTAVVKLNNSSSSLNVRRGPSTSYDSIGTLQQNQTVTVFEIQNGFYRISYNGVDAFASADYLVIGGNTAQEYSNNIGIVSLNNPSSTLNVRSEPSTSSSVIGSLSHNQSVDIIGQVNDFCKIKYGSKTGYISAQYVKNGGSVAKGNVGIVKLNNPDSSLNVRTGPSTSSTIIGSLYHNDTVSILGSEAGFYKIAFGNRTAFVSNTYIKSGSQNLLKGSGRVRLNNPSSSLNVRKGPSTSYSKIGSLYHNDIVSIIGSEQNFYKIDYHGENGFVSSDYIITEGAETVESDTGIVTLNNPSSSLNVRSGPSTSYSRLGSLYHNDMVSILSHSNGFYKIKFNGSTGYVSDDYISFSKAIVDEKIGYVKLNDPSSSLNVRSGPSTSNSKIGSLKHNQMVQIIAYKNNFFKIKYNDGTGYVSADYISINKSTSISSDERTGIVELNNPSSTLNIRSGPSTSYSKIGSLSHNDYVTITGYENGFYLITYGNSTAYVSADYVRIISGKNHFNGNMNGTLDGDIIYYSQTDPRWSTVTYSNHNDPRQTIGTSGCGPTAMSIVLSSLLNKHISPPIMCDLALKGGYRSYNSGTGSSFLSYAAGKYNIACSYVSSGNIETVKNRLASGQYMAIARMDVGHFTAGGHYIVLSGISVINGSTYFHVYDPNRTNKNYRNDGTMIDSKLNDGFILAKTSLFINECKDYYTFEKPYTPSTPTSSPTPVKTATPTPSENPNNDNQSVIVPGEDSTTQFKPVDDDYGYIKIGSEKIPIYIPSLTYDNSIDPNDKKAFEYSLTNVIPKKDEEWKTLDYDDLNKVYSHTDYWKVLASLGSNYQEINEGFDLKLNTFVQLNKTKMHSTVGSAKVGPLAGFVLASEILTSIYENTQIYGVRIIIQKNKETGKKRAIIKMYSPNYIPVR